MSFLALRIGGRARPGIYKILLSNYIDSRFRGNYKKIIEVAKSNKIGIHNFYTIFIPEIYIIPILLSKIWCAQNHLFLSKNH